jgi:UPF0755 protein
MTNEPSWEDIFSPQPDRDAAAAPSSATAPVAASARTPSAFSGDAPTSRRAAREAEGRRRGGGGDDGGRGGRGGREPKKRNLLWLKILLPIVVFIGIPGAIAAYGWFNYETQIRELLGWELPNDFAGNGTDEEVIVTIRSGDIGEDVARELHVAGVTMTFDAFYDLLLEEEPEAAFLPGNYSLRAEMSARSAFDALQDPENKVTSSLLITEGEVLPNALEIIASTTGLSLEEVTAAAADPTVYGLPATEVSLEGWLFPATYQLDGGETAQQIIQMLVDEMIARLDALGVAPENRHSILTMAALIQREAGSNPDDFYKVSRVFYNRIDAGWNLESDATVAYGTGNLHTVWTTDEERADASNLYNTYANPGPPIGPNGQPGDQAIQAAISPADGPWFFFVPVNLATGETQFSETAEEHGAAVDQLHEWCEASTENASYCE